MAVEDEFGSLMEEYQQAIAEGRGETWVENHENLLKNKTDDYLRKAATGSMLSYDERHEEVNSLVDGLKEIARAEDGDDPDPEAYDALERMSHYVKMGSPEQMDTLSEVKESYQERTGFQPGETFTDDTDEYQNST
ncbi:MAG: hypothetical protein SVU32_08390 [Candidatus Nanohaloarchaea archaeon]|nr:hypothetical protein [Candidatus Nanohaloarchaea archaeon]